MHSPAPALDFDRALRDVLETFETRLFTPIISGELEAWTQAVSEAWAAVAAEVRRQCDHSHREQYAGISKEDPELLPRIEQLRAEDEAIRREIEELSVVIERLNSRAEKAEPHEGRLGMEVEAVSTRGVAFVNRVRKQEVALRTWFLEAFNRDRGIAAD